MEHENLRESRYFPRRVGRSPRPIGSTAFTLVDLCVLLLKNPVPADNLSSRNTTRWLSGLLPVGASSAGGWFAALAPTPRFSWSALANRLRYEPGSFVGRY
jgi:hypothetical protein